MHTVIKAASILALSLLLATSTTAQTKNQLGKEYPAPDEGQAISHLKNSLATNTGMAADPDDISVPGTPAWVHGVVKAKFIIEPNLPENLQAGIFKSGTIYSALVGFGNSTPAALKPPDATPDERSMGIRVINATGKKLLKNDKNSTYQDFVAVSHPTFTTASAAQLAQFLIALTNQHTAAGEGFFSDPANKPFLYRMEATKIAVKNILSIPFFSATPYRFGNKKAAVKYMVRPTGPHLETLNTKGPDYLRKNLANNLSKQDASFDFLVQFQKDADKQPIEDPTIEWETPFIKIATIVIPKQIFDKPGLNKITENIDFNPWHSLIAHKPLGGINRVKKAVYETLQKIRRQ